MTRRTPAAATLLVVLAVSGATAACDREDRRFREIPPTATAAPMVTMNPDNQAGPVALDPVGRSAYDENAWAISQGKILYESMNCSGCHAPGGGGGMGPPLIDSLWIYGAAPENIFQTIVQGRPNGMPAYRGRLGNSEVWKLVAFVRSMAALTPSDTRSGRGDQMHGTVTNPQQDSIAPMRDRIPPEQLPPAPEETP